LAEATFWFKWIQAITISDHPGCHAAQLALQS